MENGWKYIDCYYDLLYYNYILAHFSIIISLSLAAEAVISILIYILLIETLPLIISLQIASHILLCLSFMYISPNQQNSAFLISCMDRVATPRIMPQDFIGSSIIIVYLMQNLFHYILTFIYITKYYV